MAQSLWRGGAVTGRRQDPQAGNDTASCPAAAVELRHLDARPGAAAIRHRGTKAPLSQRYSRGQNPLVPGLFGAGQRVGSGIAANLWRRQGRLLAGQWPENLDQLCR